jgi:release factor glutamine methyltransferase
LLIAEAPTPRQLAAMVRQRIAGTPLEYILGWAEFCGRRIAVEEGVFVPRRRTELLAEQAIALATPGAVVLDLCCGSGAIGAALEAAIDGVQVHAVDVDPAAARCARRNLRGEVYEGDLYEPLPSTLRGRVDIVVANAPYVPTDEVGFMPAEARLYEKPVALDGGADGLDVLYGVTSGAPAWLASGGHLLVETSERQAEVMAIAVAQAGLDPRVFHSEELGATVVIGGSVT